MFKQAKAEILTPSNGSINFSIHILVDEEIKKGDVYYLPRTKDIYLCSSLEGAEQLNLERKFGVRKVIASTFKSAFISSLPGLSISFINHFIDEYRKDEDTIKEFENVLVEYELTANGHVITSKVDQQFYTAKGSKFEERSKIFDGNVINIKHNHQTLSRKEVKEKMFNLISHFAPDTDINDFNNWINSNL